MKILLVAPFFPPQQAVASLRTHAFASVWAEAGHAVTVLTTAKRPDQRGLDMPRRGFKVVELHYPVPRLLERLRQQRDVEQGDAPPRRGFRLFRWLRQRTGIFSAARLPDLTQYWVGPALAWARDRGTRWDIVVSSSGPPTAHLAARAIKRAGLARAWAADFRDLWTENHLYSGLFPFTIGERIEERACLREADLLVTVTDGLAERLAARADKPVTVIYNGYDPDSSAALGPAHAFPADGRCRLVYTGTLYRRGQDPTPLLAALRAVGATSLALVVAGAGGKMWHDLAVRHGVGHLLEERGVLARSEALRLQRDADALVLLDWDDPGQGVLTGKLFEYLAASAPILVVGGSEQSAVARLVAETGRGMHLGSDPQRIARALAGLTAPHRPPRPVNAPLLEALSRPRQARRLLAHLEQLDRAVARAA